MGPVLRRRRPLPTADCTCPEHLAEHVGVRAIEVDAIDIAAGNFYARHGSIALKDDPHHLFLPMSVVRKLRLPPLA
jgi:hypothetical protein